MKTLLMLAGAIGTAGVLLAGCGGEGGTPGINPEDFQSTIDNKFFPLSSLGPRVFEGEERDPDTGEVIATRVESTVLPETAEVGNVRVLVVEEKDYEDGELVEFTLDYYAQHKDGTVYYFGERVDDYEGGVVVGHSGQWLAGEGANQPGVFMPAEAEVDDEFEQERAPGVAEDRSKVVAVEQSLTTPAGTFTDCIKTEDFDPIGGVTEFKFYCRGVGLVREEFPDGQLDLITY
jgi:hypothetical protein